MALFYSILLLLLFYFLLIIEFLVPSGGMLGAAAVAALVATIFVAFTHSVTAGVTMIFIAAATTPVVFLGMVRMWPHTPIGRRMLNRRPGETVDSGSRRTTPDGTPLIELVGREGIAKTDLLPSGLVSIDELKLDAVSVGAAIDAGQPVVVAKVEAGKIHVRLRQSDGHQAADKLLPSGQQADSAAEQVAGVENESGQLPNGSQVPQSPPSLEKPLESFDFE